MLKRIAFVLVVCAVVGVAFGAATKIRWFANIAEPNPDADGMTILSYVQGQDNIVAQVILSDLVPNTQYVVALRWPGTWELVEGTDEVLLQATLNPPWPPSFGFPISAANLEADSKGHLTYHGSTTPDSGDSSDSDVLIILQTDWDAAFPPDPERPEYPDLRIPVRMIGYNGTPAP